MVIIEKILGRYLSGRILGFAVSIAMVSIIGFLPLTAQAQFPAEPADFDRLLVGEMIPHGQASQSSNCRGGPASEPCSGVLNVRFGNVEINNGAGISSTAQLVVTVEARAGQEAIGTFRTPGICRNSAGTVFPAGEDAGPTICGTLVNADDSSETAVYTPAVPGVLSGSMPANIMYIMGTQLTYNNVSLFTEAAPPCVGSVESHPANTFEGFSPATSLRGSGIEGYSYRATAQGLSPDALNADNVIQWKPDEYLEYVTVTCELPAGYESELLDMAIQIRASIGVNSHQIGRSDQSNYAIRAENSLEFFPLDGSNYITHAEITEGGDGVLIEYAQAVTTPTGATYAIATTNDAVITPAMSDDPIWLNDKTVWLTLDSSIYDAGVNVGSDALSSDRHVLVSSTFP